MEYHTCVLSCKTDQSSDCWISLGGTAYRDDRETRIHLGNGLGTLVRYSRSGTAQIRHGLGDRTPAEFVAQVEAAAAQRGVRIHDMKLILLNGSNTISTAFQKEVSDPLFDAVSDDPYSVCMRASDLLGTEITSYTPAIGRSTQLILKSNEGYKVGLFGTAWHSLPGSIMLYMNEASIEAAHALVKRLLAQYGEVSECA